MSTDGAGEELPADAHTDAAAAFVDRARSEHGDRIAELYVFGSAVRGDAHGRASDVDVLVVDGAAVCPRTLCVRAVLTGDADRESTADALRDIAYGVMLEYGPVVELHLLDEPAFDRHRGEGNPFVRTVLAEGRSYG